MNKVFSKFLSTLLIASFSITAFSQSGISVNNGKLFFDHLEGQKQTQELLITNPNDTEVTLQAMILDWSRDSFGMKNYSEAGSLPSSCAAWMTVEPTNITITGKGRTTINVTMNVPSNYNPDSGVRNSMLFLRQIKNPVPAESTGAKLTTGIQMIFQIGVHLYYTHPSLASKELIINDLDFKKEKKSILIELENKGETILEAFMQFEFTNMKTGEEIKLFERSLSANFLPGNVRKFEFKLPEGIPLGEYSVTSIIDIGADQDLLLGILDIKF